MIMPQQYRNLSLTDQLSHPQVIVRRTAARSLAGAVGPQTGLTVAMLARVVDPDEQTRHWACEALDRVISPTAAELGELIEIMRQTNDGEVQYWAATMLGRLGEVASRATGVLASVLLDSSCLAARERAAWALSQIGPPARSALNALRQIGNDDPPRLRRLAEAAMESMRQRAA
jgi:HEAT repeat protein